jgi:peroxiredoxin Q/BCP
MSNPVRRLFATLTAPLALLLGMSTASAEELAPGDMAPAFELAGSDGNTYKLSQFVGKRGVVLAWFPKAFTPG